MERKITWIITGVTAKRMKFNISFIRKTVIGPSPLLVALIMKINRGQHYLCVHGYNSFGNEVNQVMLKKKSVCK